MCATPRRSSELTGRRPEPWSYGYLPPGPAPDVSAISRASTDWARPGEEGQRLLNLGDPAAGNG